MDSLSIEIKARCSDPARVRAVLKARRARFRGLDHQIDTYFTVPTGRLKLREGNIENALIFYKRADQKHSKRCESFVWDLRGGIFKTKLKQILRAACGILAVVNKRREIYFLRNVKFHIDRVRGLGNFVEIEAFGRQGSGGEVRLRKQCEFYRSLFGIRNEDLVAASYSDLLLRK